MKFYWNSDTLIRLRIVYGSFQVTIAELSSCNREFMVSKALRYLLWNSLQKKFLDHCDTTLNRFKWIFIYNIWANPQTPMYPTPSLRNRTSPDSLKLSVGPSLILARFLSLRFSPLLLIICAYHSAVYLYTPTMFTSINNILFNFSWVLNFKSIEPYCTIHWRFAFLTQFIMFLRFVFVVTCSCSPFSLPFRISLYVPKCTFPFQCW